MSYCLEREVHVKHTAINSARRGLWLTLGLLLFLSIACEEGSVSDGENMAEDPPVVYDQPFDLTTKFAIFSDPHYYDPALGVTGEAFDVALKHDRKMIAQSDAIFKATAELIIGEDAEFVLVAGDMTKDGVKHNHQVVANYLAEIEASGKEVYVVPGNHDISNARSHSYPETGDPILEPTITAEEFETIYGPFGFEEAIEKDPNSLTYIAEPKDGLWILAIDACNYDSKYPELSWVGGKISEDTMNWIAARLISAKEQGIMVLGLMHHGIVEHFSGMATVFGEYLVDDWQNSAATLANLGVQVVFTGHHHANDISRLQVGETYIVDVQTGSTVTWPSPYRLAVHDGSTNAITVDTEVITQIDYDLGDQAFQEYALDFLASGFPAMVEEQLTGFGLDEEAVQVLEPLVTQTMLAYFDGDERASRDEELIEEIESITIDLGFYATGLAKLMLSIWNDETPDNNVTIELNEGTVENQL